MRTFSKNPLLVLRAIYQLAVARLLIGLCGTKTLMKFSSRITNQDKLVKLTAEQEIRLKSIRWSIQSAAKRMPFYASCLVQAIAAARTLRSLGMDFSVRYSVLPQTTNFITGHVWITVGELEITPSHGLQGFVEMEPIMARQEDITWQ